MLKFYFIKIIKCPIFCSEMGFSWKACMKRKKLLMCVFTHLKLYLHTFVQFCFWIYPIFSQKTMDLCNIANYERPWVPSFGTNSGSYTFAKIGAYIFIFASIVQSLLLPTVLQIHNRNVKSISGLKYGSRTEMHFYRISHRMFKECCYQ